MIPLALRMIPKDLSMIRKDSRHRWRRSFRIIAAAVVSAAAARWHAARRE
jgi:hypothetical protein